MSSRRSFGRIFSAKAKFDFAFRVISDAEGTTLHRMNPQCPVVIGHKANAAGPNKLYSFTGPQ